MLCFESKYVTVTVILFFLYFFRVLFLGASISAGIFVFHVAVVPLIFKYSKAFRRNLVFANFGKSNKYFFTYIAIKFYFYCCKIFHLFTHQTPSLRHKYPIGIGNHDKAHRGGKAIDPTLNSLRKPSNLLILLMIS